MDPANDEPGGHGYLAPLLERNCNGMKNVNVCVSRSEKVNTMASHMLVNINLTELELFVCV